MRGVLKTFAIFIVAAAAGLGIAVVIHHRSTTGAKPPDGGASTTGPRGSGAGGSSTSTTASGVEVVPAAGQVLLTGTVTTLTADNAVGPPLTPPFTITIPVRGQGSADLTGVTAGGQQVEIFWYGGQPLPVSGTGQLVIDGGGLAVNASGITWMLDGAPRSLTTGHFFLGAPVAVGSSGLATPDQTESFDTGGRSTMLTTGNAQVHLKPASLQITGPGSVTIDGNLQVQTDNGTRTVPSVVFGPGSYDISLTPTASGDTIQATLQGPLSTG